GFTGPVGRPEVHHYLLQPESLGARGERPDDRLQFGERDVDGRPYVELDAVPVQPGQRAVRGAGRAQAVQAGVEDALDLRQAADPALGVAQDGQLADVGQ